MAGISTASDKRSCCLSVIKSLALSYVFCTESASVKNNFAVRTISLACSISDKLVFTGGFVALPVLDEDESLPPQAVNPLAINMIERVAIESFLIFIYIS